MMSDQRHIGHQDDGTFQCTEVHHCPFVDKLKAENERLLSAIKTHKGDRPRFNMADFNLYKEAGLMEHLEERGE
jgi:hypothetical protein